MLGAFEEEVQTFYAKATRVQGVGFGAACCARLLLYDVTSLLPIEEVFFAVLLRGRSGVMRKKRGHIQCCSVRYVWHMLIPKTANVA